MHKNMHKNNSVILCIKMTSFVLKQYLFNGVTPFDPILPTASGRYIYCAAIIIEAAQFVPTKRLF